MSLKIEKIKTNKSKIKLRPYMEKGIIPSHPFRCILNGSSGSGKSTVLINLMTKPQFYKGYFDRIVLFAPTAEIDDSFDMLDIEEDDIISNGDVDRLKDIMDEQKAFIKKKGVHKTPKVLVIFEDCQSSPKLLKHKDFLKCYIAGRHYNLSTILCSQSFTKTPRACRLQATDIIYFPSSQSENNIICDELSPPGFSKNDTQELINYATGEPYSFLYINMKQPAKTRYRKNFDEILEL
jgi:hypothetical protein